jgi:hypothetical protein
MWSEGGRAVELVAVVVVVVVVVENGEEDEEEGSRLVRSPSCHAVPRIMCAAVHPDAFRREVLKGDVFVHQSD